MQEANNKVEEVEEKMRNLKEELEMIRYKKKVFCSASCNCRFASINNVKIFSRTRLGDSVDRILVMKTKTETKN
jgi:methylphosphotriester-DNA--protein-cysteine methyltransferase